MCVATGDQGKENPVVFWDCHALKRPRIRQERKGFPTARKTSRKKEKARAQGFAWTTHTGVVN